MLLDANGSYHTMGYDKDMRGTGVRLEFPYSRLSFSPRFWCGYAAVAFW